MMMEWIFFTLFLGLLFVGDGLTVVNNELRWRACTCKTESAVLSCLFMKGATRFGVNNLADKFAKTTTFRGKLSLLAKWWMTRVVMTSYDLKLLKIFITFANIRTTTILKPPKHIWMHTYLDTVPPPKNVSVSHVAAVLKPLKRSERSSIHEKIKWNCTRRSKTHFGALHANSRLVKKLMWM